MAVCRQLVESLESTPIRKLPVSVYTVIFLVELIPSVFLQLCNSLHSYCVLIEEIKLACNLKYSFRIFIGYWN